MVTVIASNSPVLNKPKKPKTLQGVDVASPVLNKPSKADDVSSPTLNKPSKVDGFQRQVAEGSIFQLNKPRK